MASTTSNPCLDFLLGHISGLSEPSEGKVRRMPVSLSLPVGVVDAVNSFCASEGRNKTSVYLDALIVFFTLLGYDVAALGVSKAESTAAVGRISNQWKLRMSEEEGGSE